ncbi:RiPP maturation radical SAM C-methyltransferase [Streptomyces sp. NPDC006476]|uniref:RiPP maturation radical SAM C-methyltransferase n=1 Tax=Streptomyces sp. NPDC006476 TaxID=3157175 RepID=UPI0033A512A2
MRTVLVSMPFMGLDRPSIQLGLLKAIGTRHGHTVHSLHANLEFAARLGAEYYRTLAEPRGPQIGDWLFSAEAFGPQAPDPDGRLLDDFAAELSYLPGTHQAVRERLLRIRDDDVPAFLDALVDAHPWHEVQVVGFSCTFQQNAASFALARRLKQRHPHLVTVFGGANFDGEMGLELLRRVESVDLVVTGEADASFPRLLDTLAGGADPATVPGVSRRSGDRLATREPTPPDGDLDALPAPDYSEYFERAQRLGLLSRAARREVWIPFESSRGCWWGARHHCTFCGLNGTSMRFRAKSPQRVLEELAELARRYRSFRFEAVDNILDLRYLTELFPVLADTGTDYQIFYEAKANLTREHLRILARGGVTHLQPGLESLSSHVLRLMDKGVRAAQNVNLLRWARYYGIDVAWSILWGFPGETEADYAGQAAVVPDLAHLQPPENSGRIWLERFSPLYTDPVRFGLRRREPERSYQYVYPKSMDLDRIAYFFDYEVDGTLPEDTYEPLRAALATWSGAWHSPQRPALTYRSAPGLVQIHDNRPRESAGTYTFEGTLADIYLACADRAVTASAIRDKLRPARSIAFIEEVLEEFRRRGLVFRDEALTLALAVPAGAGR